MVDAHCFLNAVMLCKLYVFITFHLEAYTIPVRTYTFFWSSLGFQSLLQNDFVSYMKQLRSSVLDFSLILLFIRAS